MSDAEPHGGGQHARGTTQTAGQLVSGSPRRPQHLDDGHIDNEMDYTDEFTDEVRSQPSYDEADTAVHTSFADSACSF